MRKLWREFKAFAVSGNVLDLALGFLIGAAFASLVQSLATNVLTQLVAAAAGKPDFSQLQFTLHQGQIKYGAFLTDLLNFLILAVVMFGVIKVITRIGIARARTFGEAQCPYCYDAVPLNALVCKACGLQLVDELPDLAEARQRLADQSARPRVALPSLPIPSRRRAAEVSDDEA